MKQIFNYLEKIEVKSGSKQKKELLFEMIRMVPESIDFLRIVHNNTIYGVSTRSFEKICDYDGKEVYFDAGELVAKYCKSNDNQYYMEQMLNFLDSLKNHSGKEQLSILKNILSLNPQEAKWITRLILKDLKMGVSLDSINKSFDIMGIPKIEKFEVQLCGKFGSCDEYNLEFPIQGCIKYNGMRGFLEKKKDVITFTSRQGELIDYVPDLIQKIKVEYINTDFILDGEILCNDFFELQERIGRKEENIKPIPGLHFRVFDVIEFQGEILKDKSQKERTEFLQRQSELLLSETPFLKLEEYEILNNKIELIAFFDKIVERGEEGIVVKLLDKPYDFDSRKNWWKIKPYIESSFRVIGSKNGSGKKAGIIGSLIIEDESGKIKGGVGGLTDNDTLQVMRLERENKLIGSIVEVKYHGFTTDRKGTKKLNFPSFLKLRTDLSKADTLE